MTEADRENFTIYADNFQSKLKAIFGEDVMIKLDIFHAVQ